MLVSMTPEIQKNLEDRPTFEILQKLKTIFQQQAKQELFETVKAFHACKQEEGQSVSTYVLKMKAYSDQMERLSYPMPLVLGVNLILTSLSKDYDHTRQGKAKRQGKSKLAYDPRHKIPSPAKKEHPAKDTECHHCHKSGHWKRNCPLYLAELKKNKASASGTSGAYEDIRTLDEGFSSKNYVRKFFWALHPKWRAKVTTIKESKDLSSLALDEPIGNLKVHKVVMEKDFEIHRGKKKRIKSIALKAKKEQPREEKKSFRQRDEKKRKSDRKCFRCGDPNHLIGDCLKPSRNKDQKSFIGGS
ncbi:zf-CCHC domain-containing protein [Tanacetum coccineum]